MTHEQRRQWRRHVLRLGKDTLTATQKNVLMALETYADYRDGANAFPGHERLAEDCDITTRAVTIAITRGRELGLIEQTSPANPKAGRAAVYRIVPVDVSTGTAVPVNSSIGGTVVPLVRPIGGTGVPVENSIGGTATTPSVERPFLPPESFTRTTGVVTNSGTSPEPLDLNHPPSRYCNQHPHGYPDKCDDCRKAWIHFKAWQAAAAERDVAIATADDFARRRRRQMIDACPDCRDTNGRIDADADGTPNPIGEFTFPCKHPNLMMAEHA